jgi:hypothetical protein
MSENPSDAMNVEYESAQRAPRSAKRPEDATKGLPYYDLANQYVRIEAYLIPGESIYFVFDCKGGGTGFVGITDQRLIFYDEGLLFKKKTMVSVSYNQVIGVGSTDDGSFFTTSEISLITAAGNFTFEFRGADKAHAAYAFIMNQILNQANPQLRDSAAFVMPRRDQNGAERM